MKIIFSRTGCDTAACALTSYLRMLCYTTITLLMATGAVARQDSTHRFTFSITEASLLQAFDQIEKQSPLRVMCNANLVKKAGKVTVSFRSATLGQVMDGLLAGLPLGWELQKDIIIVKPKTNLKLPQVPGPGSSKAEPYRVSGLVVTSGHQPLAGASIKVAGTSVGTTTGSDGGFDLYLPPGARHLEVSFIGFQTRVLEVGELGSSQTVLMVENPRALKTIEVSTGYQVLPQERATGSFAVVDSTVLHRQVGTDVVSRLEGTVPGLLVNKNTSKTSFYGGPDISIRGRSTIMANDQPLIVVDNFPFDGSLGSINPNDIKSITVLKDAAAASIWGARAGNGVIVITTRHGKVGQPMRAELNVNMTTVRRPDLFYNPNFINAADFIGVEQFLFDKGYYRSQETGALRPVLSPVVELLIAKREGRISDQQAGRQMAELAQNDIRRDFSRHLYRQGFNQQYALSISGGTDKTAYYVSFGHDRNRSTLSRNSQARTTLFTSNTFRPLTGLELQIGVNLVQNADALHNSGWGSDPRLSTIRSSNAPKNIYPYARLTDDNGQPATVVKDFRYAWVTAPEQQRLADWTWQPLRELDLADNTATGKDLRVNLGAAYRLTDGLDLSAKYQYQAVDDRQRNHYSADTYFARNLFNTYSVDQAGTLTHRIPAGGILDHTGTHLKAHTFRGQANYQKVFGGVHQLSALAGVEVKQLDIESLSTRLYGYNDQYNTSARVDYAAFGPVYPYPSSQQIPNSDKVTGKSDRFVSWFANASYTFLGRYILSGSVRKDASNFFGLRSNRRGVPLWSAGLAWNLSEESFYDLKWLPSLKLRATYGFNGNLDKSVTALTTAYFDVNYLTGLPEATIINPPNPELRWERVGTFNAGIDFSFTGNRITGSLEYYRKKGTDLFGLQVMSASTGLVSYKGNAASTKGQGIDLVLNSTNIESGDFRWTTNLLASYARDQVVRYGSPAFSTNVVQNGGGNKNTFGNVYPVEGRPLFAIYSFPFAGLEPATGDPQGYLSGKVSKDYNAFFNPYLFPVSDLMYHGPARPVVFGSLRNTVSWKGLSLSVSLLYKLGYYFKRSSIHYADLFSRWIGHEDFGSRWQKAGDELRTHVPSMVYPAPANRDNFYNNSNVLVERGDHIRFQDLNVSYTLTRAAVPRLPIRQVQLYVFADNLGIIWRANRHKLDPDGGTFPEPRTFSVGVRTNF